MTTGTMSALESGRDTFYAFYTDGVLRDVDGTARLDDTGRPIHDGWVTAIGPMVVAEVGADAFRAEGWTIGAARTLEAAIEWGIRTKLKQQCSWNVHEGSKLLLSISWNILGDDLPPQLFDYWQQVPVTEDRWITV